MSAEPELHILLEIDNEAIRWRRRAVFLASVLFHGLLILFLLVEPQIFRRGARLMGMVVEPQKQENTFLLMPPDLLKRRPPPRTNILSDKNRHAEGPSPVVKPNGLEMPYMRGNTPLPKIAGGAPTPPPAPPKVAGSPPAPGENAKSAQQQTPPPPEKKDQLKLEDVPRPSSGPQSARLRLPLTTPGDAIQQSLEAAARGRASGAVQGPGDSPDQLNNLNPNFSTEGPVILSDTRGVDFGPYLARVVYVVRQNWYAVIPESARLGEKGRVGIIFEIVKDGSVPQIRLVASSGSGALDRAALASIRASNPFPPLPQQFTGKHLVLQFVFLYNMGYGYRY
jgi:TonB family protein